MLSEARQYGFGSRVRPRSGALLTVTVCSPAIASEPCSPPNVMSKSVCDMDSFHDAPPGQVPDGWTEFILSGNPSFAQDGDTFWGPPSLRIRTFEEGFKAGIYTQVPVQPGAGYRASVARGRARTRLTHLDDNLASTPRAGLIPTARPLSGDPCIGDLPASSTTRRRTSTST